MKRLVVTEPPGWICYRLGILLGKIPQVEVVSTLQGIDLKQVGMVHYLPYYLQEQFPVEGVVQTALFTHAVPGEHEQRYDRIAKKVAHCVVMCTKYRRKLIHLVGLGKVTQVHPPYHQLCQIRPLVVGWFHRSPPGYGKRKRKEWLEKLSRESWIHVVESGGRMSYYDVFSRMKKCDVILVTSKYEAGPMCLMESLACGVPVVIGRGVGLQEDFDQFSGVIPFDTDNYDDMLGKLRSLYAPRERLAQSVEEWTEENWIAEHEQLFRRIADEHS